MLILSRKKNEWIRVGDDIRLVVSEIRGDKVKLGFEAPESVKILREELCEEIARDRVARQNTEGRTDGAQA